MKTNIEKLINQFEDLIKYHTHHITDDRDNKWKVIEVSDIENIINELKDNEN